MNTLWDKILQQVERRVNPHSFATWFRPTRQERAEDNRVVIRVPTKLFAKRLKETYGEILKAVLVEIGRPQLIVEFVSVESEPVPGGSPVSAPPQARLDFESTNN